MDSAIEFNGVTLCPAHQVICMIPLAYHAAQAHTEHALTLNASSSMRSTECSRRAYRRDWTCRSPGRVRTGCAVGAQRPSSEETHTYQVICRGAPSNVHSTGSSRHAKSDFNHSRGRAVASEDSENHEMAIQRTTGPGGFHLGSLHKVSDVCIVNGIVSSTIRSGYCLRGYRELQVIPDEEKGILNEENLSAVKLLA